MHWDVQICPPCSPRFLLLWQRKTNINKMPWRKIKQTQTWSVSLIALRKVADTYKDQIPASGGRCLSRSWKLFKMRVTADYFWNNFECRSVGEVRIHWVNQYLNSAAIPFLYSGSNLSLGTVYAQHWNQRRNPNHMGNCLWMAAASLQVPPLKNCP